MVSVTRGGSSYITVTDLFCGAGGSSTGLVRAGGEIKTCANHWQLALESHNANHPNALHVLADIAVSDPKKFPRTDILWASPECDPFTLAAGRKRKNIHQMDIFGKHAANPGEDRSRVLMWDVCRFAAEHHYPIVLVENVVEIATIFAHEFEEWLSAMHALGYDHQEIYYNAMFAPPCPQSRDRLYVAFWRRGNKKPDLEFCPPAYCTACVRHVQGIQVWKNPRKPKRGKYGIKHGQYVYRCPLCQEVVCPYYMAAATAIDWSNLGSRIGDRARPLKEKTMERIRRGLEKYAHLAFLVDTTRSHDMHARVRSVETPWPSQTAQQEQGLVAHPSFLLGQQSGSALRPTSDPSMVVSGGGAISLLVPAGGTWNEESRSVHEAYPAQTSREVAGLLYSPPPFLMRGGGEYMTGAHPGEPLPTQVADAVTTELIVPPATIVGLSTMPPDYAQTPFAHLPAQTGTPVLGLATAPEGFLISAQDRSIRSSATRDPFPAQTSDVHRALIVPYHEHNTVYRAREEALGTVTAGGKNHGLLIPYLGHGEAHTTEEPTRTVTAKEREALLTPILPDVEDCRFRMLQVHEIQAAMAFPSDYVLFGTQRQKVEQLGNSVVPSVAAMIAERCIETLAG